MKNTFVGLLIFLVVLVFVSLALQPNEAYKEKERYDAYVSYENIEMCTHYVTFMECVVEKIDDVAIQRIYKNNIYTTVRNWATFEDATELTQACEASVYGLEEEVALHGYGCTIDTDDAELAAIVIPKEEIEQEQDTEEPDLEAGDEEIVEDDIEEVEEVEAQVPDEQEIADQEKLLQETITAFTRVEVLQNRVGYLRIRERGTTSSLEVGRLGIGDIVEAIDLQNGWYLIRYGDDVTNQGRVSAEYVRNIGLLDE